MSAGNGLGPGRAWRADPGSPERVRVCKPKLPDADKLLPYLREIDAVRRYSNEGPLVRRLEERLARHTRAPSAEQVVATCNATAGLTAALLSLEAPRGTLCMLPSWTFAASGHAVVLAGLVPWLVDVDESGVLRASAARQYLGQAPGHIAAVIVVSPFGQPVDTAEWAAFQDDTGLPVVLDAAAGFETVRTSRVLSVVSLHATKIVGCGEGAYLTSADEGRLDAVRRRTNFGFGESRESQVAGMNAKLSEYAAAVALAALDDWPSTRSAFRRVALAYVDAFRGVAGIRLQPGYGTEWLSATAIIEVPPGRLEPIEDALAAEGIGSRRWWGDGLAAHRAFIDYPAAPLPATRRLAETTLGLPCSVDLETETVERIAHIVAAVCNRTDAKGPRR